MRCSAGTRLGPYEILAPIGAGGMGEVYRARDTRLGREVALKILSADVMSDPDRQQRFQLEARTASALNHPNIVTIYDIGSEAGCDFIAMEYVEGESLRRALPGLELKRAVELMAQAASALAAAHQAGVVHRDIKPENLMLAGPVGRARHLKILDFGLAKLMEARKGPLPASDAATLTNAESPAEHTKPGALLGTVAYMSPEQAEGRVVDHRTDIFSLGLVLYEVLTGRPAFRGKSTIDTLHAIIHDEPAAATDLNPRLPAAAADILAKALAKDPSERYHHAGDFELDLRRLIRAPDPKAQPAPRSNTPNLLWGAAALLAIVAAFFIGWRIDRAGVTAGPGPNYAGATLTQLTSDPGLELDPTFSPDGETIAYCSDRTGNFEIFLKQVSGGTDINLTNNPADDIQPAFSPDGKQIAFVSSRAGSPEILDYGPQTRLMGGSIWVMPALGGSTRRIVASGSFPSWSPDGSRIVFMSGTWFRAKLYSVAAAGGEPEEIPVEFPGGAKLQQFANYPRYSSDGAWIVFETSGDSIYVVSAKGGEARRIAHGRRPVWGTGSHSIIYSDAAPGRNYSLWEVPFSAGGGKPPGSASPLTIGRGWDMAGAVSPDAKRIAFSAIDETYNLEILAFDAEAGKVTGSPRPVTSGNHRISFFSFSPDSRSLVFEARRGAESHIWRLDEASTPVQLTSGANFSDGSPKWSPDGRAIAFGRMSASQTEAGIGTWLMAADGANPQPLLENTGSATQAGVPSGNWLPDGRGMVYRSGKDQQLHVFDLATKHSRRLTDEPAVMPILKVSPDGKWVVYQSTMAGNVDIRAVPMEGGTSRVVVGTPNQDYHPFFSPSGRWLYFHLNHKNLWRVPGPAQSWRAAQPEKITNFAESGLLWLEDLQGSPDGRQLAYAHGRITGDIWMLTIGK